MRYLCQWMCMKNIPSTAVLGLRLYYPENLSSKARITHGPIARRQNNFHFPTAATAASVVHGKFFSQLERVVITRETQKSSPNAFFSLLFLIFFSFLLFLSSVFSCALLSSPRATNPTDLLLWFFITSFSFFFFFLPFLSQFQFYYRFSLISIPPFFTVLLFILEGARFIVSFGVGGRNNRNFMPPEDSVGYGMRSTQTEQKRRNVPARASLSTGLYSSYNWMQATSAFLLPVTSDSPKWCWEL